MDKRTFIHSKDEVSMSQVYDVIFAKIDAIFVDYSKEKFFTETKGVNIEVCVSIFFVRDQSEGRARAE